jgi:membrane fusion protein (multidrug efflux system)
MQSTPISKLVISMSILCCLLAPAQAEDASPVTLTEVIQKKLQREVKLSGSSIPWRRVWLSPMVEGLVSKILVDDGTWLKTGNIVLKLDASLAKIEIDIAKARINGAKARQLDAQRRRDDLLKLRKNSHVSKTAVESVHTEVAVATAELAQAQAELARARTLHQYHTVLAPFSGMIVSKQLEVGQWVKPGDNLVELLAIDTLRLRVLLPQRYFPLVTTGSKTRIRFDAIPKREFTGRVLARIVLGNKNSRSFPLLIDIPNPKRQLAPGMSAQIWIELNEQKRVLMLPRDAIITKSDGSQLVWQVKEKEGMLKAFPLTIETGRYQGSWVEILSNKIQPGERIVLLGNENLRPNQAVKVPQ